MQLLPLGILLFSVLMYQSIINHLNHVMVVEVWEIAEQEKGSRKFLTTAFV